MRPGSNCRSKRLGYAGYSLAELPAGMIFLFVGLVIPMIVLCSITYRASIFYFAVRDSCIRAAKAPTFSEARTRANASFTRAVAAFSEISGTQQIRIVVKPLNGDPATIVDGPIPRARLNANDNLYLIRETATGTVAPLVAMNGGFFGMSIPGLTGTYPLTLRYDALVENTDGLSE